MNRLLLPLVATAVLISLLAAGFSCRGPQYDDGLYAEIQTNKGRIVLSLEFEKTPMTAANFVGLAEGTIKNAAFSEGRPYFDGTVFHRVVPGHVIQCGIPAAGAAQDPGYRIPNEIHPGLDHGRAGMVNMANAGPHTNGSQWCVTLGDRSYLDGDYTVFGRVVEGMDVVFEIVQGDVVEKVRIVRVGPAAKAFRPATDSFRTLVEQAWDRVRNEEAEKEAEEEALVAANWPEAVLLENGLRTQILSKGRGALPKPGDRVSVAYSGRTLSGDRVFVGTAEDGKPYWGETSEAFSYEVGSNAVNPGFDAAVSLMTPGEKRVVIVPAEKAYGVRGHYAPERPGEKRFVIRPNTVLVYEIERLI